MAQGTVSMCQGAMFSFTAHEFKKHLKKKNPMLLERHHVNNIDRTFLPMVRRAWKKNLW